MDKEQHLPPHSSSRQKRSLMLYIAELMCRHPFISAAVVCFFCTALTTASELSYMAMIIPAVAVLFVAAVGSAHMCSLAPAESKKPLKWCMIIVAVVFAGVLTHYTMQAKKPQMLLLNTGLMITVAAAVYFLALRRMTDKKASLLLIAGGFLMRLTYIMCISINSKQHDAGSVEKMNGHIGYIASLFYNGRLEDIDVRTVNQFYHPPLHHFIASMWVKLQTLMGISFDSALENVQILTLFYSCICMILAYKIFRSLGLRGVGLVISMAVIAFCPTFYILAGSINNDILAFTFMLGAVLNTIYWCRSRSMKRIIAIAVCIGCGMMTKLSAWMVAPAVALIFIAVFFSELKSFKKYLVQFGVFLGICAPLGLWWGIRNLVGYGVPITYVIRLSDESQQYVGNIPVMTRLFDFSLWQFENPGDCFTMYGADYNEFNPLVALMKTSVFDEHFTVKNYPDIEGFDISLLAAACALAAMGFIAMVICMIADRDTEPLFKGFIGVLYGVNIVSYYIFCFEFPHVCTMNIRYAVMLIIVGAFFTGRAVMLLFRKEGRLPAAVRYTAGGIICAVSAFYCLSSIAMYEIVFK